MREEGSRGVDSLLGLSREAVEEGRIGWVGVLHCLRCSPKSSALLHLTILVELGLRNGAVVDVRASFREGHVPSYFFSRRLEAWRRRAAWVSIRAGNGGGGVDVAGGIFLRELGEILLGVCARRLGTAGLRVFNM